MPGNAKGESDFSYTWNFTLLASRNQGAGRDGKTSPISAGTDHKIYVYTNGPTKSKLKWTRAMTNLFRAEVVLD